MKFRIIRDYDMFQPQAWVENQYGISYVDIGKFPCDTIEEAKKVCADYKKMKEHKVVEEFELQRRTDMKKCDCYHTQIEKRHTYHITGVPIYYDAEVGVYWGTRERDECSCGGDRAKCDFYPEVREKALKEREPKLGEWISVEDRLPKKNQEILVYRGHHGGLMNVYTYIGDNEWEDDYGYWSRADDEGITHWMPLPVPPTEKAK